MFQCCIKQTTPSPQGWKERRRERRKERSEGASFIETALCELLSYFWCVIFGEQKEKKTVSHKTGSHKCFCENYLS